MTSRGMGGLFAACLAVAAACGDTDRPGDPLDRAREASTSPGYQLPEILGSVYPERATASALACVSDVA